MIDKVGTIGDSIASGGHLEQVYNFESDLGARRNLGLVDEAHL